MTTLCDELIALYARVWDLEGDDEISLVAAEERLGTSVPELLRAAYGAFGLRRSAMVHLWPLKELRFEADNLVFGSEQQGTWFWGIPRSRMNELNPLLRFGHNNTWEEDTMRLSEWLRYHAMINRIYEPPCFGEDSNEGAQELEEWPEIAFSSRSLGDYTLRCKAGVVADPELVRLGAKTEAALREAMLELDIDDDCTTLDL